MVPVALVLMVTVGQAGAGFEARTLGGGPAAGPLRAASAGAVTVGDTTVAAGDWFTLRRAGVPLPPWPRAPHVELTTGDRLTGAVVDADGDALRWRVGLPGAPDQLLRFPLSAVRAVWLTHRPANAAEPDWLAAPRKRDLFLSRNGDSAAGALTALDPGHKLVRFQAEGKDHQLDFTRLAAVAFNTDLARVRRPKGPYYRLTLADGSRMGVQSVAFDGRLWTVTTPFRGELRVPADQVVSVDVEQGKVASLSDQKPARYEYLTTDGEQFAWVADRCVTGRPLTLRTAAGESTFDRGLGLHAECTLTYSLAGKYRRFEALAGLDARSGVRGDARLVVRVDGKEQPLPNDGRLTHAGGPVEVRVDLAGARDLVIVVRRAGGGIVQDHVNLAEARLVP